MSMSGLRIPSKRSKRLSPLSKTASWSFLSKVSATMTSRNRNGRLVTLLKKTKSTSQCLRTLVWLTILAEIWQLIWWSQEESRTTSFKAMSEEFSWEVSLMRTRRFNSTAKYLRTCLLYLNHWCSINQSLWEYKTRRRTANSWWLEVSQVKMVSETSQTEFTLSNSMRFSRSLM